MNDSLIVFLAKFLTFLLNNRSKCDPNEPPRYPIHIHMFGCFHVHTYVHIERDKSEMLPVLFMLLPLPPLLMMCLLPPGFDLDMLRDRYIHFPFVEIPLPLLMMIGKESDLRSPPLLALMLLSRMPMMVLVRMLPLLLHLDLYL